MRQVHFRFFGEILEFRFLMVKIPIRMRILVVSSCLFFALVGCKTLMEPLSDDVVHTLSGNPRIPVDDLREFFEKGKWEEMKDVEYDAYVILRGAVEEDRSVTVDQILDFYPDDSRNDLALKFAKRAAIVPNRIGTRVKPAAKVYVVFYEKSLIMKQAMVFAKQQGALATDQFGHNLYVTYWYY